MDLDSALGTLFASQISDSLQRTINATLNSAVSSALAGAKAELVQGVREEVIKSLEGMINDVVERRVKEEVDKAVRQTRGPGKDAQRPEMKQQNDGPLRCLGEIRQESAAMQSTLDASASAAPPSRSLFQVGSAASAANVARLSIPSSFDGSVAGVHTPTPAPFPGASDPTPSSSSLQHGAKRYRHPSPGKSSTPLVPMATTTNTPTVAGRSEISPGSLDATIAFSDVPGEDFGPGYMARKRRKLGVKNENGKDVFKNRAWQTCIRQYMRELLNCTKEDGAPPSYSVAEWVYEEVDDVLSAASSTSGAGDSPPASFPSLLGGTSSSGEPHRSVFTTLDGTPLGLGPNGKRLRRVYHIDWDGGVDGNSAFMNEVEEFGMRVALEDAGRFNLHPAEVTRANCRRLARTSFNGLKDAWKIKSVPEKARKRVLNQTKNARKARKDRKHELRVQTALSLDVDIPNELLHEAMCSSEASAAEDDEDAEEWRRQKEERNAAWETRTPRYRNKEITLLYDRLDALQQSTSKRPRHVRFRRAPLRDLSPPPVLKMSKTPLCFWDPDWLAQRRAQADASASVAAANAALAAGSLPDLHSLGVFSGPSPGAGAGAGIAGPAYSAMDGVQMELHADGGGGAVIGGHKAVQMPNVAEEGEPSAWREAFERVGRKVEEVGLDVGADGRAEATWLHQAR